MNDCGPFVERDSNRVERADIRDDAVAGRFCVAFRHERPKQAVPYHEYSGVVAIEVLRIGRVVHPMMRRRIEQIFEPRRHPPHRFGVDPELIEQVESLLRQNHRRREAEEGQRDPRCPGADDDAGPANTMPAIMRFMMMLPICIANDANVSLTRYLALMSEKLPSAASRAIMASEMARNRSGRLNFRCKAVKYPGERGGQW